MGRLSEEKRGEALRAYFEEGLEVEEIARRLGIMPRSVSGVLNDPKQLEIYRQRSEAAKLRAQIHLNENAEQAAKKQAALLLGDEDDKSRPVIQRAAKDILDRAGVRVPREEKRDITITFAGGAPELGMPRAHGKAQDE